MDVHAYSLRAPVASLVALVVGLIALLFLSYIVADQFAGDIHPEASQRELSNEEKLEILNSLSSDTADSGLSLQQREEVLHSLSR